jgi:hypothetical protein
VVSFLSFLRQECFNAHVANPDPPPKETCTLQLLDNTKALWQAMDQIRMVKVQFSSKIVGNVHDQQLRMNIYDSSQKVRIKVWVSCLHPIYLCKIES